MDGGRLRDAFATSFNIAARGNVGVEGDPAQAAPALPPMFRPGGALSSLLLPALDE
jgi:hypothetical protein